jgi:hypothetical protein
MSYNTIISWIYKINEETGFPPSIRELMEEFKICETWAVVCLNDYNTIKINSLLKK